MNNLQHFSTMQQCVAWYQTTATPEEKRQLDIAGSFIANMQPQRHYSISETIPDESKRAWFTECIIWHILTHQLYDIELSSNKLQLRKIEPFKQQNYARY